MKKRDNNRSQKLGMNASITRRDILHGLGAGTLLAALPNVAFASSSDAAPDTEASYPPALTGMRGNHDGSFDVGHQVGRYGQQDWGRQEEPDEGVYDLVVVGGGISGLSAAHFYKKEKPDARILILDNHDDFGGHAKRNEFQVDGKTMLGYGGAQTLQEPSNYPDVVKEMLSDLGVKLKPFEAAYDQQFFKRHGLKGGLHFNKEKWGEDRVVPMSFSLFDGYLPIVKTSQPIEELVSELPISEAARVEFLSFMTKGVDEDIRKKGRGKWEYLSGISYREFLTRHGDITQEEIFDIFQDLPCDLGAGIEAVPAADAIDYSGLPGAHLVGWGEEEEVTEPYIHHFPDGNASVARLLVRSMIPAAADGNTMEDIVAAKFDYGKLDQASDQVRLRLNSTVVGVKHIGSPESAGHVWVSYVKEGVAYRVKARGSVLACNNSMIPYICPDMPEGQRDALSNQVKVPILYTNVVLRNWQPWKKMGISSVYAPGSYHVHATLDFPVSIGGYSHSAEPDQPVIVHMERFPHINNQDLTVKEQHRAARQELLETPFEDIDLKVREQLTSMLGDHGFDPETDILGITVNRWAHGYSYYYNSLFDTLYDDYTDERYPHMIARKPFGKITIANADSGANAMFEAAVEQGYRAVQEQL